ncbi:DnaB-like helicase C-terminal domain-containing protein [Thermococcus sp.]|uniref:DnaB-like helicase C-terminal domain-containing protein n=1 Tax=Thermococcus sp. TaxID=35749 RepID=UPI0026059151|nr:DnaB-like helicase C-terminal domain-containing protein [Thermococcus sp.]MCD6143682.1 toprim domain-containing protein [Thermococcus sp.]
MAKKATSRSRSPLSNFLRQVKSTIDFRQVVENTGVNIPSWKDKKQVKILCPFHDDRNPSLALYADGFHCFGCGAHGDHLDWLRLYAKLNRDEALERLSELAKISAPKLPSKPEKESIEFKAEDVIDLVNRSHEHLLSRLEQIKEPQHFFLIKRGLGKDLDEAMKIIKFFKLGYVDAKLASEYPEYERFMWRLIIPHFGEEGIPLWFTARTVVPNQQPKYLNPSRLHSIPFNLLAKEKAIETGYCIITEGAIDAMSLLYAYDFDAPIFAFAGGTKLTDTMKKLLNELVDRQVTIYLLTDPDKAGEIHKTDLMNYIRERGGLALDLTLKYDGNIFKGDVNEFLQLHGSKKLTGAVDNAMQEYERGDKIFLDSLPQIIAKLRNRKVFTSGIKPLDEVLGGGFYEGLHIIGGITSAGKTSLALYIAENNALQDNPVLYFTYEQPKHELWWKIYAKYVPSEEFSQSFKIGAVTNEHIQAIQTDPMIQKITRNLKILEGDEGLLKPSAKVWTVPEIAQLAQKIAKETPPLVIVDYIQRVPAIEALQKKDIRERIDAVVGGLQTLVAREIGCTVIGLSSISRSAYDTANTHARKIGAFKESGGIEFTGYTVILLWQDDEDIKKQEPPKYVHIELLKNRQNGKLADITCMFDWIKNSWEGGK